MATQILVLLVGLFLSGATLIAWEHRVHQIGPTPRKRSWLKFTVYLGFVSAILVARWFGPTPGLVLIAMFALAALRELRLTFPRNGARVWAVWIGVALGLGHLLLGSSDFNQWAATILLVSATDAFAQLTGKLWGRNKLCPALSPGKTVEGLIGGLVAAGVLAIAIGFLLPGVDWQDRVLLGLCTGAAAVVGDLSFSWLKRQAGVKDFSKLLPGHGGILDRVDSLVVGAPVFYWTLAALG